LLQLDNEYKTLELVIQRSNDLTVQEEDVSLKKYNIYHYNRSKFEICCSNWSFIHHLFSMTCLVLTIWGSLVSELTM